MLEPPILLQPPGILHSRQALSRLRALYVKFTMILCSLSRSCPGFVTSPVGMPPYSGERSIWSLSTFTFLVQNQCNKWNTNSEEVKSTKKIALVIMLLFIKNKTAVCGKHADEEEKQKRRRRRNKVYTTTKQLKFNRFVCRFLRLHE